MKKCGQCQQECCRSVIIEIDKPETLEDWEHIKWKVAHKNIQVIFDNDNSWCVEFFTDCEHLLSDGKCEIYNKRPKICREYEIDSCVVNGEGEYFKIILKNIKDVEDYLRIHPI